MISIRKQLILAVVITAVVTACLSFVAMALFLRPVAIAPDEVALDRVADGEYIGFHQNKILFAVVRVTVESHRIAGVEVLAHKDSYMDYAQQIAGAVVAEQSLEVDTISGATFTCDTVKMAIENALLQGME